MIVEITRSYRYDPESVAEGERLYREAAARVVLREIEKRNKKVNNYRENEEVIG
jgi:hypothetical protein